MGNTADDLIRRIKIGVFALGYNSMAEWSIANGFNPSTTRKVLLRIRRTETIPTDVCASIYVRLLDIAKAVAETGINNLEEEGGNENG